MSDSFTPSALKVETPPAKKPAKTTVDKQETRNHITRPKPDSLTGKVWTVADVVKADKKVKDEDFKKEVVRRYVEDGGSKGTAGVQVGRWIKFHV